MFAIMSVWGSGALYTAGYLPAAIIIGGIGVVQLAIVYSAQIRFAQQLHDILKGRS